MTRGLQRPIFVVGCPRSGTTLVQCILSASSHAFSLPETHFFSGVLPALAATPETPIGPRELRQARQALETEAELRLPPEFWVNLAASLAGPGSDGNATWAGGERATAAAVGEPGHVVDGGAESLPASAGWEHGGKGARDAKGGGSAGPGSDNSPQPRALDIFLALVEVYRPAGSGELRAIEKTPRHVLCLDTIAQAFPDAVFVNVVRSPIDVASSLLGVPFESSRSMLSYAQRWTESVQAARSFARAQPSRLLTVVYETLVREPEAAVRNLSRFVGVPYEPAMLEEFGREAGRNVGRGEAWKGDVKSGVIVNRQGVWRTRMTPGQAWLVAQATRGLARELGYAHPPVASASSILKALLKEAGVRFREARSSTGVVGAARHAGSVLKTLAAA